MRVFSKSFKMLMIASSFILNSSSVFAESADSTRVHHEQNNVDWSGIYLGFIPCADCKGVKTSLALNPNKTYILLTQYVGKSEREFVEKGTFIQNENKLTLTARKTGITHHYTIDNDQLIQTEENGQPVSAKLANRYILRKNKVVESAKSPHSGH